MICIFRLAIVASRKAQAHYRRQKQRNQLFHALFPLISFEYMKKMGQDVLLSHFVWCSYCSLWSSRLPETASLALLTTFSTMSGWVLV